MAPAGFESKVNITFIGTATSIINIDGVNLLTDPAFDKAGTEYDMGFIILKSTSGPALEANQLPTIDAVLLSHEDHPDNLDTAGRALLEGKIVLTTVDGANKLKPNPMTHALLPWETLSLKLGGKDFKITGTPCQHLPGGEVTGFILETPSFGTSADGLPNVIYISGDTVYLDELVEMRKRYHIALAILNLGNVLVPGPDGPLQITFDAKSAARLARDIGADVVVPMHYDSWEHFVEPSNEAAKVFEVEGLKDKVVWLTPGVTKQIL